MKKRKQKTDRIHDLWLKFITSGHFNYLNNLISTQNFLFRFYYFCKMLLLK